MQVVSCTTPCYVRRMVASAPELARRATLADFLAIPEEQRRRLELVDGSIVERGAASGAHGAVQRKVSAYIDPYDRRPGGRAPGGWWFATEVDVYFDESNTLRPDVAGWRRDRVPARPLDIPVMVRPDWVCEVLSTNKRNDLVKKKRVYHRHQVPHYWIIDPEQETLTVHKWGQEGYVEIVVAERGETVRAEPFDVLPLQVGVLLGDDEDDG
jgi:Uma2 family endonuclease